jgi:hypothetical protein
MSDEKDIRCKCCDEPIADEDAKDIGEGYSAICGACRPHVVDDYLAYKLGEYTPEQPMIITPEQLARMEWRIVALRSKLCLRGLKILGERVDALCKEREKDG